jgi:2-polyprenyl-3-methyl-5-hydroxy-6-metoxy-1,4-benzoquinol methylase
MYTGWLLQTALISPNEKQFDLLQQRLKERLEDGRGETIFDIGIGEGRSLSKSMASNIIFSVFMYFLILITVF